MDLTTSSVTLAEQCGIKHSTMLDNIRRYIDRGIIKEYKHSTRVMGNGTKALPIFLLSKKDSDRILKRRLSNYKDKNNKGMLTSVEIAEETGITHKNILRHIENNVDENKIIETCRISNNNRRTKMLVIPKENGDQIIQNLNLDYTKDTVEGTMSTMEIAERTGRSHKSILRVVETLYNRGEIDYCKRTRRNYRARLGSKAYIVKKTIGIIIINNILLNFSCSANFRVFEKISLTTIEQLYNITLKRQYSVGNYLIDGYDEVNKIAYEIDEPHHLKVGAAEQDKIREDYIKSKLGCTFVRIKISE